MSRSPIHDRAAYGPDISFAASLRVVAEVEHLLDGGLGLLCRLCEGDGPAGADVLVIAGVMRWSHYVLSHATVGDMVALTGKADPVDAGAGQTRPLLQVSNPASLEIWRRVACGPTKKHTDNEIGGATA